MTIGNSDRIGAFFDADKTIIDYNTMSEFKFQVRHVKHECCYTNAFPFFYDTLKD